MKALLPSVAFSLLSLVAIAQNGNVGIGTTIPDGILDLESAGNQTDLLLNNTGTGDPVIGFQLSGVSKFTMGIDDNDSDKFKITSGDILDTLEYLTITTDGKVGINTKTPGATLHVNGIIQAGADLSYDKIRVYPSHLYSIGFNANQTLGFLNSYATTFTMFDGAAYGWLWRDYNDASSDGAMSLTTDGRLYVKSTAAFNGNVGIGTSTPSAKLDVIGEAEFNGVIESGLTDDFDKIRVYPNSSYTIGMKSAQSLGFLNDWATTFTMNNDLDRGWLWRDVNDADSDGAMSLTTDGRLYVKGTAAFNGNVGIGTSVPIETLDVNGTMRVGSGDGGGGLLDIIGDGGVQGNMVINRVATDGTLIRFRRDGGTVGTITVASGVVSYNAFTGSHYAWTDQDLETGMLVTMTGENNYLKYNTNGEIIYGIRQSTIPNDPKILGAYLKMGNSENNYANHPHLVMAAGNGELWVVDGGKDLEIGDYLISSHVPGHAMRDEGEFEISYIIARAAEPVNWAGVHETISGVKHKKISVLFENFTINHGLAKVTRELHQVKGQLRELQNVVEKLNQFEIKAEQMQ